MRSSWSGVKRVLCIRADNMGDVLMSSPCFRALKSTFSCHLTLLTSKKGAVVAPFIPQIDKVIAFDLPWVESDSLNQGATVLALIEELKKQKFDACVTLTVYSQNPQPSLLIAYLAEIPLRLAYCRENPYHLLTHWIPDKEPYEFIQHQVERDLNLVASVGARTEDQDLVFEFVSPFPEISRALRTAIGDLPSRYLLFQPGVSDPKRRFPKDQWIELGKEVWKRFRLPILCCGNKKEEKLNEEIVKGIGEGAINLAGKLSMEQWAKVIHDSLGVVSVNSGIVHMCAAMKVPVVVLYAQSNPQHKPWRVRSAVLEYSVEEQLKSKNEVLSFVNKRLYSTAKRKPSTSEIIAAVQEVINPLPENVVQGKLPNRKRVKS